ncbi:MAG: hypothetical protein KBC42_01925 [Candidatus Pacebacteria bacterium]|nr:hypothetical protein [Candidatus Paceibacterota bacterium]MBP9780660.1 hypothetical protein [Candidatus Paceibacterota bacterium]
MTVQKRILTEIFLLIAGIFLVNIMAMKFHWYSIVWWFDMPMHTLGGMWIALTSLFVYKYRRTTYDDITNPKKLFFVALICVIIIGLLWEIFEFGMETVGTLDLANPIDSISDLCFDLVGGVVGTMYFIYKYERVIKSIDKV